MDRMGQSLILSFIHTDTIGTVLKFNGGNNGYQLKMFHTNRPLLVKSFQISKFYSGFRSCVCICTFRNKEKIHEHMLLIQTIYFYSYS